MCSCNFRTGPINKVQSHMKRRLRGPRTEFLHVALHRPVGLVMRMGPANGPEPEANRAAHLHARDIGCGVGEADVVRGSLHPSAFCGGWPWGPRAPPGVGGGGDWKMGIRAVLVVNSMPIVSLLAANHFSASPKGAPSRSIWLYSFMLRRAAWSASSAFLR